LFSKKGEKGGYSVDVVSPPGRGGRGGGPVSFADKQVADKKAVTYWNQERSEGH